MNTVTTTELLIPSRLQKECCHVARLDLEVRVQHRKGRSCVCRNALAGACCLSARRCQRLPRSAKNGGCASFLSGADCSPALACSDRQPHQAELPRSEAVSSWERRQQQLDRELDQKLIICRGC